jgi:hypothetical protein
MVKLLNLISPKVILLETEEKHLPEEFKVSEGGYNFLKNRIEALNKKATKYKVPPIEIVIVNEEMVKVLRPEVKAQIKSGTLKLEPGILNSPEGAPYWTQAKKYTIKLKGEPPHIDGYEFIARLEHTKEGNFVYTNPKSSVPNLPAEFKSMNQHCDVCKTNRDRNDTFVVKMEKEDPIRFPGKKAGDLLVVGRNCLARFMPGLSVAGLVMWTKMVDNIEDDVKEASGMEEGDEGYGGGGGGKYYEDTDHLLKYLAATYLFTGVYISKKQALANSEMGKSGESTLSRALGEMRPYGVKDPHKAFPVYYRLIEDPEFLKKVEIMMAEFEAWVKTKDFDALAVAKPEFTDFFHNIKLVSSQEYLRGNHFGFFAALFQLFLRDKKDQEKKKEADATIAALPPSPVTFDAALVGKRLRDVAKETEIKRLASGGVDEKAIKKAIRGKEWGWEVTVNKLTEYEKTKSFGYGDSGIGYRINFKDAFGNDFLWFASNSSGFVEGGKYIIDGTITGYDPNNKYTNRPQTRINRVKIVKDYSNPSQPPQPEPPAQAV